MFCGYSLGRLDSLIAYVRSPESKSFVSSVSRDQKQANRQKVDIDDRKYVTDIPTGFDGRASISLGTATKTKDDISSASDRLAQLKKTKG